MPLMRRRPLLRAAAVGGGAYYAGKSRQRSQEREVDQEARIEDLESQPAAAPPPPPPVQYAAPPPPPPRAGPTAANIARLPQLGELHERGPPPEEEFPRQKTLLL